MEFVLVVFIGYGSNNSSGEASGEIVWH